MFPAKAEIRTCFMQLEIIFERLMVDLQGFLIAESTSISTEHRFVFGKDPKLETLRTKHN